MDATPASRPPRPPACGRQAREAEKSLVLCRDEKSQYQALEHTQIGLPLVPRRPASMTHDKKRPGVINPLAVLDALAGKLIARAKSRHTRVEWRRFLRQFDRDMPKNLESAGRRRPSLSASRRVEGRVRRPTCND